MARVAPRLDESVRPQVRALIADTMKARRRAMRTKPVDLPLDLRRDSQLTDEADRQLEFEQSLVDRINRIADELERSPDEVTTHVARLSNELDLAISRYELFSELAGENRAVEFALSRKNPTRVVTQTLRWVNRWNAQIEAARYRAKRTVPGWSFGDPLPNQDARTTGDLPFASRTAGATEPMGDASARGSNALDGASNRRIRQWYLDQIAQLGRVEDAMRAEGRSEEEIARRLVGLRNGFRIAARAQMPDPRQVEELEARDLEEYGDPAA